VNITRVYRSLLGLYPRDYRALFAAEMVTAFEQGCEERRGHGRTALVRFTVAELAGLAASAGAEWIAKLTTNSAVRGRCLPDRMRMRPPGVPWEVHYAGAFANASERALPEEVADAQKRTEFLVSRIVHAIAHHDFERARTYSFEESQERENLRRLREKYGISE
jgi:hypothetical protein